MNYLSKALLGQALWSWKKVLIIAVWLQVSFWAVNLKKAKCKKVKGESLKIAGEKECMNNFTLIPLSGVLGRKPRKLLLFCPSIALESLIWRSISQRKQSIYLQWFNLKISFICTNQGYASALPHFSSTDN